jgi:hypothetical protein
VESDIAPYKGLLMGLFFMTVGMEISVALFLEKWKTIVFAIVLLVGGLPCLPLPAFGWGRGLRAGAAVALRWPRCGAARVAARSPPRAALPSPAWLAARSPARPPTSAPAPLRRSAASWRSWPPSAPCLA